MDGNFTFDMRDKTPAFYINERGDVHTTGVYVTRDSDENIMEQLVPEIMKLENEQEILIIQQVDRWDVCVRGRFTPIGRIYALAMLDPEWRPS